MNILMIQSAGKSTKNAEYKKTLYTPLNKTPCVEARLWGPGYDGYETPFNDMLNWCHVVLFMEDYRSEWVPPLKNCKRYKIFWSMDTHMKGHEHLDYAYENNFNLFLTAVWSWSQGITPVQKKYEAFDRVWFPNTYPDHLFEKALENKHKINHRIPHENVRFVGNVATRGGYIKRLSADVGLRLDMVVGDEMPQTIFRTSIHWNKNIADDINARTFETLGSDTFLITDETPGLAQLFDIGKHLVTYSNYDECVEKIRHYLRHPEEREEIAIAGHEHCKKNHSETARAKQLLDIIRERI